MDKLARFLPLLMVAVLAVAFLARLMTPDVGLNSASDPMLGKPMPSLTLPPLHEGNPRLATDALKGEPYLFNVFASWCSMCQLEHGQLKNLSVKSGLPLYGMAWKDDPIKTQQWLERMGNIYTAVGTDQHSEAAIELGLVGAPETYLVDADGNIAALYRGALSEDVVRQRFLTVIDQQRDAQ